MRRAWSLEMKRKVRPWLIYHNKAKEAQFSSSHSNRMTATSARLFRQSRTSFQGFRLSHYSILIRTTRKYSRSILSILQDTHFCISNSRTISSVRPCLCKWSSSRMLCWHLSMHSKRRSSIRSLTPRKRCSLIYRQKCISSSKIASKISCKIPMLLKAKLTANNKRLKHFLGKGRRQWMSALSPSLQGKNSGQNGKRTSAPTSKSRLRICVSSVCEPNPRLHKSSLA